MYNELLELQAIYDESKNIVFFGGAGVSTESGLPDFRSIDGLYNQKWEYRPETILSHSFFMKNPREFYRFYKEKMMIDNIKPNIAHIRLAEMEKVGKLSAIVTQNIDNLHQMAGSKNVIELHGSIIRNHCMKCNSFYNIEYMKKGEVPICEKCGGIVKPDVILYEEPLDSEVIEKAITSISNCDTLIIAGTSLSVYPAASFINYFRGMRLVVINKDDSSLSNADLIIKAKVGEVLEGLKV